MAIYGLHAALDHNDAHISRLYCDCVTYNPAQLFPDNPSFLELFVLSLGDA